MENGFGYFTLRLARFTVFFFIVFYLRWRCMGFARFFVVVSFLF